VCVLSRQAYLLVPQHRPSEGHVAARKCPFTPPFASKASGNPASAMSPSILTGARERGKGKPLRGFLSVLGLPTPKAKSYHFITERQVMARCKVKQ
jgi:hypothetical protein